MARKHLPSGAGAGFEKNQQLQTLMVENARAMVNIRSIIRHGTVTPEAPVCLDERVVASNLNFVGRSPAPNTFAAVDPARLHPRARTMISAYTRLSEEANRAPLRKGQVVLVIPARNEATTISSGLTAAMNALPSKGEILLILNAVQDNTEQITRQWAAGRKDVTLIEPGRVGAAQRPRSGTVPVTLLVKEEGGKLRALATAGQFLRARGTLPEFVMQLDADTHLRHDTVQHLMADAGQGYSVVGGRALSVPPEDSGKHVVLASQFMNALHGSKQGQFLAGCAILSRTPTFIAAHQAMFETMPEAVVEDALYSLLLHAAGEPMAVDPQVPVDSLGETDRRASRGQLDRWVRGEAQLNELVLDSKLLRELGLGAMSLRASDTLRAAAAFGVRYFHQAQSARDTLSLANNLIHSFGDAIHIVTSARHVGTTLDGQVFEWNPRRDQA